VWGFFFTRTPRYILAFLSAMVFFLLSMIGRNKLATILSNFLPMITYWAVFYFAVLLEENVIFRRKNLPGKNDAYDWEIWNDPNKLPAYVASTVASLFGVAGAVLGMNQAYYRGPIALQLGEYGADFVLFTAFGFTAITYPAFRSIEVYYRKKKGLNY
jgi:purine-cytosine permease-like protein